VSIASDTVPTFRAQWASRFVDGATLNRTTVPGAFNDTTGQYGAGTVVPIYSGSCLIRPASRATADFGQKEADVESYSIMVPHTATGARPGDRLTVDASVYDPDLVGAVLVLREIIEDSYLTHYEWKAEREK